MSGLRALIAPLALVTMVLGACGSGEESSTPGAATTEAQSSADGANYTIGYVATDSGPSAGFGVSVSRGVEFAVDEINRTGFLGDGVELELLVEDSAGDPARGIAAVNRLADQDVSGIICCQPSAEALSMKPVLIERGIPAVATVARAPGLPDVPHVFRTVARGESAYERVLNDVGGAVDATTVVAGVNGDNDGVKNDLEVWKAAVAASSLELLTTIDVATGDTDFSGAATQVIDLDPDIYVNSMLPDEGALMIKALRDRGFAGAIVSNEAIASGNAFRIADAALDGVVFPVAYAPGSPIPAAEAFTEVYAKETGEIPDLFVAQGYTAVWFLAHGLKAAGNGDPFEVGRALSEIAELDTVYGTLSFADGDALLTGDPLLMAWNAQGTLDVWDS